MIPNWYDSNRCGQVRLPDVQLAAKSATELKPKFKKNNKINAILAVIDMQVDFIAKNGALSVPGAIEDCDRLNRFIFNNVEKLTHIVASLDTHYLFQPFHSYNWAAGTKPTTRTNGTEYKEYENPEPFTIITLNDIKNDTWRPLRHPIKMLQMLEALEQQAKKNLCIWPLHCLLGSTGHSFDPSFMESLIFHATYNENQYDATIKGMSQLSEHYGILQAEVEFPEDPRTSLNVRVLEKWESADVVYFAGQARTHCVLETLNQIVKIFQGKNQSHLLKKLVILEDCMSNVPDITDKNGNVIAPFSKWADDKFEEFRDIGFRFAKSTDMISK